MLTLATSSQQITIPVAGKTPATRDASDETLVAAIGAGDRGAMRALYLRHNVRVYRFVLRLTGDAASAEDIVSEVFLEVWRQAAAFEARSQAATWILGIARYKALSALRGRSHAHLDDGAAMAVADPADDAETVLQHQDRSAIIRKCLSQLSAIHREVLDLVYYHDKSVDEVAEIVGVPPSTVKTRMFYARRRMEGLLENAGVLLN